jgi:hypothetical protein
VFLTSIERRIIKDIMRKGLSMVVDSFSILKSKGWLIHTIEKPFYIDGSLFSSMDIFASKIIHLQSPSIFNELYFYLMIRVEKLPNLLVFWAKEKELLHVFTDPISFADLILLESTPILDPEKRESLLKLSHYHNSSIAKIGLVVYEPFKKRGENKIHEAITHIIDITNMFREYRASSSLMPDYKNSEKKPVNYLFICYSVIITNAKFYVVEFQDGAPSLFSSELMPFLTSKWVDSMLGGRLLRNFVIDFVNLHALDKYLELLDDEIVAFSEKLSTMSTQ